MRGFAGKPDLPSYQEVYGLRAAAIAVYPMYKGLARLVGMEIIGQPATLDEQIDLLKQHWADYDFFFLHFKYTDSTGEDGNFAAKVKRTEEFDAVIPRVVALNPDVLIVTGDHSTPAYLKSHSWHPVPTLLVSDCCRPDGLPAVLGTRVHPRWPGPVRGQVPDVAGAGQCRPIGQVRCVTPPAGSAFRSAAVLAAAAVPAVTGKAGRSARISDRAWERSE